FLSRVIDSYGRGLRWVLRHQPLTLMVTVATLLLTVALYLWIPKGFFPVQDTGLIQGISDAPQSISFAAMSERQQRLAQEILRDADVESLSSFIGIDGSNTSVNSGRMLINLRPHGARSSTAGEVIERLQQRVSSIPGIVLYMQPVQDLTIEDRVSRTQFQFTLSSPDSKELALWTQKLSEKLRGLPQLGAVASDLQDQGLQAWLDIDRDTASRLGVSVSAITDALYDAFGQRQVSTIFTQSNQYRVVLEADPRYQQGLSALRQIHVPAEGGAQVPLSTLVRVSERPASLVIHHLAQFPAATVSFNLAPDTSLGDAVAAIEAAAQEVGLPPAIEMRFQGAADAFRASLDST